MKKGEKHLAEGISWKMAGKKENDDENDDAWRLPVSYHLFHRSQVQPLTEA